MKKALILYGDSTQALPIARSLKRHGFEVHATISSRLSYGWSSRFIDKRHYIKDTHDVDSFYRFIIDLVKHIPFDIMVPMHDDSAKMMSKYREMLSPFVHYVMPDLETFERGFDKHRLMEVCQKKNYPHPETILVEGGDLGTIDIERLHFPLLIKPNHTFGARGMTYCSSKEELVEVFPKVYGAFGDCHLQRFVPEGGNQVEVQLYVNERKELVQSSVIKKFRWYPEKGGSSCCNISCQNEQIVDICYQLLKDIGWVGFADFDTIEDPGSGELLIMELNPRVPACVKSCFASGIDWADVIANEYEGHEHRKFEYKKDVFLRHLGFEVLWFFYSKNRWKTKPSWFKLIGRNIYYQDMSCWSDPLPFFTGTIGNMIKQLSPSFRAQKSGTR
jgi:predicted ATP-grasp superfamily ATP-dependent carboligase